MSSKVVKKNKKRKINKQKAVKRIKRKINKQKRKKQKKSFSNLKIFNINKLKYNFAVLKLVSLVGISTLCSVESHNSDKYIEEPVLNVQYKREISNLNIEFNKMYEICNNNLTIRFNSIKTEPIEIINETNNVIFEENNMEKVRKINNEQKKEINNEIIEETNNEIVKEQENGIPEKYREVVKVLEMNEPSLCGMKLSREYESIIIDIANEFGFDSEIMLTEGEQESDGKWDNNGVISPTNDYGVFQINICNHKEIYNRFGFTSEDLQYDPIKNAIGAAFLNSKTMFRSDVNTLDEIFGMYNGWVNWRKYPGSIAYVNGCNQIMDTYFPSYTYENNKELLKRM